MKKGIIIASVVIVVSVAVILVFSKAHESAIKSYLTKAGLDDTPQTRQTLFAGKSTADIKSMTAALTSKTSATTSA